MSTQKGTGQRPQVFRDSNTGRLYTIDSTTNSRVYFDPPNQPAPNIPRTGRNLRPDILPASTPSNTLLPSNYVAIGPSAAVQPQLIRPFVPPSAQNYLPPGTTASAQNVTFSMQGLALTATPNRLPEKSELDPGKITHTLARRQ